MDQRNRRHVDEDALLEGVLTFPLVQALLGRRSRRFSLGAEIPDGPLSFKSRSAEVALTQLEQLLVLSAAGGNTGWHGMITRHSFPGRFRRCSD